MFQDVMHDYQVKKRFRSECFQSGDDHWQSLLFCRELCGFSGSFRAHHFPSYLFECGKHPAFAAPDFQCSTRGSHGAGPVVAPHSIEHGKKALRGSVVSTVGCVVIAAKIGGDGGEEHTFANTAFHEGEPVPAGVIACLQVDMLFPRLAERAGGHAC